MIQFFKCKKISLKSKGLGYERNYTINTLCFSFVYHLQLSIERLLIFIFIFYFIKIFKTILVSLSSGNFQMNLKNKL